MEEFLFNYAGEGKKEESYDMLMELSARQVEALKFKGGSIKAAAIACEWRKSSGLKASKLSDFREFISWLFGKNYRPSDKTLERSEIEDFFFNYAGKKNKKGAYDKLTQLTCKDIRLLEIKGNGIRSIIKLVGWTNPEGLHVRDTVGFRAFIDWLFGEEYRTEIVSISK